MSYVCPINGRALTGCPSLWPHHDEHCICYFIKIHKYPDMLQHATRNCPYFILGGSHNKCTTDNRIATRVILATGPPHDNIHIQLDSMTPYTPHFGD